MVGRRGNAPLVPPYILCNFKRDGGAPLPPPWWGRKRSGFGKSLWPDSASPLDNVVSESGWLSSTFAIYLECGNWLPLSLLAMV